jgi:hypothetical protein
VPLVTLPKTFLSDLILTQGGLPPVYRWLAQILPLTHANAVTRNLPLKRRLLARS